MEWVEITGRTVQEATDLALDELGVDEADAEVQVLEEPRAGLFGRTRGTARVKARVIPRQHRPKQERRDRRRGRGSAKGAGNGQGAPGGGDGQTKSAAGGGAGQTKSAGDGAAPKGGGSKGGGSKGGGRPSGRSGGSRGRSEDRSGDRRSASPRPDGGETAPAPGRSSEEGDTVDTVTMSLDEHVACVQEFVTGLVTAFGLEAEIEVVTVDDDTREIQVKGDDLGLLIGPRGQTLQAVHELARTVVYRKAPDGQDGRVRIDIGGYRERRREALERFAATVAADVVESGRAKALEPMSPPDRKVVHDAINSIEGVRTTSEGEEPRRRVVVHPAD